MTQISPNRSISVKELSFAVDGSFATLRAVQEYFKKDLYQLRADIIDMRVDQIATLLAIGSGGDANLIGQSIVDSIDVTESSPRSDYIILKVEILAWLTVAMAPKVDREKKSADMTTLIERQKTLPIHGRIINDLPSDSSDGSQANSGEATSGS